METPRRDQINRGLAVFESPGHDLLLFLRYKIIQFLLWRIAAAGASNKNDSHIKRRRRLPLELQCEVFSTLPFQYGRRILLLCRPIAINCVALVRKLKERLKNGWDPTACHEYLTLIESGQLGVQHFPSCYSVYAKRPIPKNGIFYYEVNIIVGKLSFDAIGLATKAMPFSHFSPSEGGTYAFWGNGTYAIYWSHPAEGGMPSNSRRPSLDAGDVIGCGVNLATRQMFHTAIMKNRHIVNIPVVPPYMHTSVDHSANFVDPLTNTHTNHVEGFWKNAKKKNKEMCGTTEEMLPSYLDEFQWRQLYGRKTVVAFDNILDQISNFYPVNL
uniref:B30.2/SPRY domain-containing protein n=1 Tax=Globodera rostochiensis TaxID=31243 RepID=A0A914HW03_GLORO